MKNTNFPRKAISLLLALITVLGVMPLNIIALGEEPSVTIQYNGSDASSISLVEDDKLTLDTKVAGFDAEVKYQWEILADEVDEIWVKIGDKTQAKCEVTYALVKSCLDKNSRAQMRVSVTDGEFTATSNPVEIKVSYRVSDSYGPVEIAEDFEAKETNESATLVDSMFDALSMPVKAAEGTMETVTITVRFVKNINGVLVDVAYSDIRTLRVDYEEYTVICPTVLGYDCDEQDYEITVPVLDELLATNNNSTVITVMYSPKEVEYTINHWQQNVENDEYVLKETTTATGLVDSTIPASSHKSYDGFEHLYYERLTVAPDGSTEVDIYYDRVYYQVLFDYDGVEATGQENVYVRYGTKLTVNNLESAGAAYTFLDWTLSEYNDGAATDAPSGVTQIILSTDTEKSTYVYGKTKYRATWELGKFGYTILYWAENANDGFYSLWHSEWIENSEQKSVITWDDTFLDYLEAADTDNELQFFTFEEEKTLDEIGEGVSVRGDGSTVINVYYARRSYKITFRGSTGTDCALEEHDHEVEYDTPCEFVLNDCTNPNHTTHVHTDVCGDIVCGITTHRHNENCCSTHIHNVDCYKGLYEEFTSDGTFASNLETQIKNDVWEQEGFLGGISSYIFTQAVKNEAASAGNRLATASPPKNLQNGSVQYLANQSVTIKWQGILKEYSVTSIYTIPAIYIEDGDGDPTNNWYYYSGTLGDGEIQEADNCDLPDHDHTSACDYSNCTTEEHVHNSACYSSCNDEAEQHTPDCYGKTCIKPVHNSDLHGGDNVEILILEAKYGQDISAYLPYYKELQEKGIHQKAVGDSKWNFVGWQYAGTGWDDEGETRYVKHVTMVSELCYSAGVDATAIYDANATETYYLYYLFESFDQSSESEAKAPYRQNLNGVFYDYDPDHYQIIMWPPLSDGETYAAIDGAEDKAIEGFTYLGNSYSGNVYSYFYSRNLLTVRFENPGNEADEREVLVLEDLPYGISMSQVKAKALEQLGIESFTFIPYPNTLEEGAYEFDEWYSTPKYAELSKINWETDILKADTLLTAKWVGVWRTVEIYEDSSLDKLVDLYQGDLYLGTQKVRHNNAVLEPSHTTLNPAYGTDEESHYTFVGWFYMDGEEEKAFSFSFPIKQDMQIYPKWTTTEKKTYTINFVTHIKQGDEIVETIKIADSYSDAALIGQNITVNAKTSEQLYEDYREAYFPTVGSHTIKISADEDANVFTFEYILTKEDIEYRVEYLDSETGLSVGDTEYFKTKKAGVTALFLPFEGYEVDEYAKSLILTYYDGDIDESPNVISFYYTKSETPEEIEVPWAVHYYMQNTDGETYSQNTSLGSSSTAVIGTTISATPLTAVEGFVLTDVRLFERSDEYPDGKETQLEATDGEYFATLGSYGLSINFYYERVKVDYTVKYVDSSDGQIKYSEVFEGAALYGEEITVFPDEEIHGMLGAQGYQIDEATRYVTQVLKIDNNEFIIRYTQANALFIYEIVCDNPSSGVGLSATRQPIDPDGTPDQYFGSIPYDSDTYYFAGWFTDPECTVPATSENSDIILEDNDVGTKTLTPQLSEVVYGDQTFNIYLSKTYYALFLPRNADTSITVSSGHGDNFILELVGKEGDRFVVALNDGVAKLVNLPIDEYSVTIKSDWSWRYGGNLAYTFNVEVVDDGVQNTLVIDLTNNESYGNSQWLDDYAYGTYSQE